MYFLKVALAGMQRRWFTTLVTVVGSAVLLTSIASISMWAYWLGWEQKNLKVSRTVAVFVNTADENLVKNVIEQVQGMNGVADAHYIVPEEFMAYVKAHFSDLADSLAGLGTDVIPRMVEVSLEPSDSPEQHKEVVGKIAQVANVSRVDDGAERIGQALGSLRWLSFGGGVLCLGLWFVLFIVCLNHYQGILYSEAQEVQLIRSFGATRFWILMPWWIEALAQAFIASVVSVALLGFGRQSMAMLYNQFFGTLGYDPFVVDIGLLAYAGLAVFVASFLAHSMGGVVALLRGKLA